ncbi:antitoxin Xre/MbcA/ParS toxin-binding domain-containing protein [Marinobacter sp. NP-4(2019)]|uniref:antitoxin Xre/MbcA/ParS toxin-binding domain-containing protein n=1 Tax=Marinobacter sp. NP-4(2019) TaxID=2488665 RepID=UPI0013DEE882|nr:antitoxin Xre/MbcA/ParS toxin-binding domain-containing protein [Marinobacter sp. NP-4(2019)]
MNTEDFEKLQAQAYAEVLELFSYDANEVDKWLLERVRGLNYMTPKEALQSEEGISKLRTLIGRLQHGIPT